jgi:hypothetical protein
MRIVSHPGRLFLRAQNSSSAVGAVGCPGHKGELPRETSALIRYYLLLFTSFTWTRSGDF